MTAARFSVLLLLGLSTCAGETPSTGAGPSAHPPAAGYRRAPNGQMEALPLPTLPASIPSHAPPGGGSPVTVLISGYQFVAGEFQVSFAGAPATLYDVLATSDFASGWQVVATILSDPATGAFQFTDPETSAYSSRFYVAEWECDPVNGACTHAPKPAPPTNLSASIDFGRGAVDLSWIDNDYAEVFGPNGAVTFSGTNERSVTVTSAIAPAVPSRSGPLLPPYQTSEIFYPAPTQPTTYEVCDANASGSACAQVQLDPNGQCLGFGFRPSTPIVDFGAVPLGATTTQQVTFTNTYCDSVALTLDASAPPGFSLSDANGPVPTTEQVVLTRGQSYPLTVTFVPDPLACIFLGSLEYTVCNNDGNACLPTGFVTLRGVGASATQAVAVNPSPMNFGTVPVATSSAQQLTFTNNNLQAVQLSLDATGVRPEYALADANGPVSPTSKVTLPTGGSYTLDVTFTPDLAANFDSSLTVTACDGFSCLPSQSVAVNGVGTDSCLTVTPNPLTFTDPVDYTYPGNLPVQLIQLTNGCNTPIDVECLSFGSNNVLQPNGVGFSCGGSTSTFSMSSSDPSFPSFPMTIGASGAFGFSIVYAASGNRAGDYDTLQVWAPPANSPLLSNVVAIVGNGPSWGQPAGPACVLGSVPGSPSSIGGTDPTTGPSTTSSSTTSGGTATTTTSGAVTTGGHGTTGGLPTCAPTTSGSTGGVGSVGTVTGATGTGTSGTGTTTGGTARNCCEPPGASCQSSADCCSNDCDPNSSICD